MDCGEPKRLPLRRLGHAFDHGQQRIPWDAYDRTSGPRRSIADLVRAALDAGNVS
jgi:hypothetical protein